MKTHISPPVTDTKQRICSEMDEEGGPSEEGRLASQCFYKRGGQSGCAVCVSTINNLTLRGQVSSVSLTEQLQTWHGAVLYGTIVSLKKYPYEILDILSIFFFVHFFTQ